MTTYSAGIGVPEGVYLSPRHFDLAVVSDDGILNGPRDAHYIRVPLVLAIVMGPMIGGLYAVAFPLIILWAFACAIGRTVLGMRSFAAGEPAPWGMYVGLNRVAVKYLGAPGEVLPGKEGTRYFHVPSWITVLVSPLLGAAYVVFLPFIMAGIFCVVVVELLYVLVTKGWKDHAYLTKSNFEPAASYIDRPEHDHKEANESGVGYDALAELEEEVRGRQEEERK